MFNNLSAPALDPILSLMTAFKNDPNPEKIDLGVGVYRNDEGDTPVMAAVKEAEKRLLAQQDSKSYIGLPGDERFNQLMIDLVISNPTNRDRSIAVQTPGASGALRLLADMLKAIKPNATVWLSNPSYVNHQPIMENAGLKVEFYPYFNPETKMVDEAGMIEQIAKLGEDDVVLLHGCCHNPTGADISIEAWEKLTELAKTKGFLPFIDIAYQGLGDGVYEDIKGLNLMLDQVEEALLTVSCSKSFGLYRERTGAAIIVGKEKDHAVKARANALKLARGSYSMPPDHGAAVVKIILEDEGLTKMWKDELDAMLERVLGLRKALATALREKGGNNNFDFIEDHKGMFTVTGLSEAQMLRLQKEFSVYGVGDGRINMAGLSFNKVERLADAILAVTA